MLLCIFLCSVFFFFKQKTAYELRISDWSSDVCSSDLSGTPCPVRDRSRSCSICPPSHDMKSVRCTPAEKVPACPAECRESSSGPRFQDHVEGRDRKSVV